MNPATVHATASHHPTLSAGWRRAAVVTLFALLAVLQGLAPLLHTHVTTAAADAQTGIHLPVAPVHAQHAGTSIEIVCGDADDPAAITAPPEWRRDERLAARLPVALATVREFAAPPSADAPLPPADATLPAARERVLRPPAQGPPVAA